jgi:hypothetical protein
LIDYAHPELWTTPGPLTCISDEHWSDVVGEIGQDVIERKDEQFVSAVHDYMRRRFRAYAAGGALVAKRNVDRIIDEGTLSGCHDWGLVLTAVLRRAGVPAVFVDTVWVPWAREAVAGTARNSIGHIFVEAYIGERWVLVNSTASCVTDPYDPLCPHFRADTAPRMGETFFVLFKGLDPKHYGISEIGELTAAMKSKAPKIIQEAERIRPQPAQRPLLDPTRFAQRMAVLGPSRVACELFMSRFRAAEVRAGLPKLVERDYLDSCDTIVLLLPGNGISLPGHISILLEEAGSPGEDGVYRLQHEERLFFAILANTEEKLLESIRAFQP